VRNVDGCTNMSGEVIESSPQNKLSYTWQSPESTAAQDTSRVTFELETIADTVKLTVTHDKLERGSEMAGKISQGWPLVLSSLKSLLETGEALDILFIKSPCSTAESKKENKKEKVAQ